MFINYIKEESQRPNIHINGTIILKFKRKILKFNDVEFYNDEEENEISDEELGI